MNNEEKLLQLLVDFGETVIDEMNASHSFNLRELAKEQLKSTNMSQNELRAVGNNEVREKVCNHSESYVDEWTDMVRCKRCNEVLDHA